MLKNKKYLILTIILMIVIVLLTISNIYYINKSNKKDDILITEKYVYQPIDKEYNPNKKYYKSINYDTFKKYLKGNKIRTIAIVDNSSKTHKKFLETINKIVFYKNTNIYILEVSKLSKKNTIAFYDIDERFSSLNSNYIIVVKNNKILSITSFDNDTISEIEKGIGE